MREGHHNAAAASTVRGCWVGAERGQGGLYLIAAVIDISRSEPLSAEGFVFLLHCRLFRLLREVEIEDGAANRNVVIAAAANSARRRVAAIGAAPAPLPPTNRRGRRADS